jgi:hypothetical protein
VLALAEAGTKVQVAGVHPSTPPSAPWRPGDQCHRDGARTGGRYLATCCAALVTRGLSSAQGGVNLRAVARGPGSQARGTQHAAARRARSHGRHAIARTLQIEGRACRSGALRPAHATAHPTHRSSPRGPEPAGTPGPNRHRRPPRHVIPSVATGQACSSFTQFLRISCRSPTAP